MNAVLIYRRQEIYESFLFENKKIVDYKSETGIFVKKAIKRDGTSILYKYTESESQ